MPTEYAITLTGTPDGLWLARCDQEKLLTVGPTLRDALDDMALVLDRIRRDENDNAPHAEAREALSTKESHQPIPEVGSS
jgi:hypothetical protein